MELKKYQYIPINRIRRWIDGDTFIADLDFTSSIGTIANNHWLRLFTDEIPVRLAGINCPELHRIDGSYNPLGLAAKELSEKLTKGRLLLTLCHPTRDKYFRLNGILFADGVSVNFELVRNGLAEVIDDGRIFASVL